jgi:hypothetical protein
MPQAAAIAAVWVANWVGGAMIAAGGIGIASTTTYAVVTGAAYYATLAVEVVALGAVMKATTPKMHDPGTAMSWQSDPKAGVPYGVGYGPIGGNTVFAQSCGENAKYMNFRSV